MIGTRLSHYTISARLGEGGMGVVYRAVDSRLNRTVALKVLAAGAVADPDRKRRFIREARAASALNHPNIVTIHDIDEADDVDFLVMELIDGQTLERLIPEAGLPVERALDYAIAIAAALDAAHAADIVHRDIKPANIMVADTGAVKVLDFGIAKLLDRVVDEGAPTAAATGATEMGLVVGTLRYMSPEQAQGQRIDRRSDIFSFGAVVYEMLAGRPAFGSDNTVATLAALLKDTPAPLDTRRRDLPPELVRLVQRCLEKNIAARPTADDVVNQLTAIRATYASTPINLSKVLRRPRVLIPLVVVLLACAAGGGWWWTANSRLRRARNTIPEIQRLADGDDYDGAYRLAREAIAVLPDDPQLKQLWLNVTSLVTLDSSPAGADIAVRGYLANTADWIPLGRTPLETRVPFGQVSVRVSKDGFAPVVGTMVGFGFKYTLDPPASIPAGMVRVLGSVSNVEGTSVALDDYWLDRFEVTNRQFKTFVDRGGYRTHEYWKEPFVGRNRQLSWEEAMAAFRDTTGRPGPSTWDLGTYPEGQADFPVTGVSWYEAAAYAAFAGKSLPTAFHWRGAAGVGNFDGNFAGIILLSNFAGKGPATVGSYKGLGPFGTYDMAGNAKEWCWNEAPGGRMTLGGAFSDPNYTFYDRDAQPPLERLATYGLRLAQYITPPSPEALAPIQPHTRDYTKETPVDDATFEILRSFYRYDDSTNLHVTVEGKEEAPAWVKETVSFDAAYGNERVRAFLYLPKNASPPYQTVVYFPGGDAQVLRSSRDLGLTWVDFVIRSGRALLYPVYKGTYERRVSSSGVNARRDLLIERVKDVSRSIDYLETRPDIDKDRIGYYGVSVGAYTGIVVTAIESRFKASVLDGGGLLSVSPPPETDRFNFAPRIHVPTLMVNGKADYTFPLETSSRPLFRLLGLPPDRKHHMLFEGGHIPDKFHDVIKEILDWYDRFLGPVTTSG